MEEKIKNLLNEIGVRITSQGYEYLVTAVKFRIITGEDLTGKIYKEISRVHKKSICSIERCLKHSYKNAKKDIEKYFNLKYSLNNTALIFLIADRIKYSSQLNKH